jgi:hydrogenase maturation protease
MRAAIMCIGNILLLDEGVGPRCAQYLSETYEFPDTVDVLDSGTMGMSLLTDIEEHDIVVVIDAVDGTGADAGTVFTFTPDEVAGHAVMHSLHDLRFKDVLNAAALLGYEPIGTCVGVQVLNMDPADFQIGLTEPVEKAVPLASATAVSLLVKAGVEGISRKDGRPLEFIEDMADEPSGN